MQSFLKHFQGQSLIYLPGQAIPMSNHTFCKEYFFMSCLNFPWCSLMLCPHVPSQLPVRRFRPPQPHHPVRDLKRLMRSHLRLLFSRINIPSSLRNSSQVPCNATMVSMDPQCPAGSPRPFGCTRPRNAVMDSWFQQSLVLHTGPLGPCGPPVPQ